MRREPWLLIGILPTARGAGAQQRFEPSAAVTFNVGVNRGQAHWSVASQAQPVDSTFPAAFDTLALGRTLRPGRMASVLVTYFRSARIAFTGELAYISLPAAQHCRNVTPYFPEREQYNQQACGSADGKHTPSGLVALQIGGSVRIARGVFEPYFRWSAGAGQLVGSFVETRGHVTSKRCRDSAGECDVALYPVERRAATTWIASLAAGTTVGNERSFRLRLELRTMVTGLPAVTGSTPLNEPYARTGYVVRTVPTLTAGLDVPLVRKHERRY